MMEATNNKYKYQLEACNRWLLVEATTTVADGTPADPVVAEPVVIPAVTINVEPPVVCVTTVTTWPEPMVGTPTMFADIVVVISEVL
jgi:hypothetical protein